MLILLFCCPCGSSSEGIPCAPANQGSSSEGIPGAVAEAAVDALQVYRLNQGDIRAQQRDRNETARNEKAWAMEQHRFAERLGLLDPRPFAPGEPTPEPPLYEGPPGQSIYRAGSTTAAREARNERLRNAAVRQFDINTQADDTSMEDQRGPWMMGT